MRHDRGSLLGLVEPKADQIPPPQREARASPVARRRAYRAIEELIALALPERRLITSPGVSDAERPRDEVGAKASVEQLIALIATRGA